MRRQHSDQHKRECTCNLTSLLYLLPSIFDLLAPDAKAALAGCNTELRRYVHNNTSTIFLNSSLEITSLVKTQWPRLFLVVLCNETWANSFIWPKNNNVHLLSAVSLAAQGLNAVLLIVIPQLRQDPNLGHKQSQATSQQLSVAMSYLRSPHWRQVSELSIKKSHLQGHLLQSLVAVPWHHLEVLDLSDIRVDAAAATYVAEGSWPALRQLNLSRSQLDAAAMHQLAKGYWPALQELNLSSNNMGASTIAELVLADMPMLKELCLMHNRLDRPAMAQLLLGRWTRLEQPQLQHNCLDDYAILTMLAGNWLVLRKLSLHHNKFSEAAAAQLVHGHWPGLSYLSLDEAALSINASWAFRLTPKSSWKKSKRCFLVPRYLTEHWPSMLYVVIVRQAHSQSAQLYACVRPLLTLSAEMLLLYQHFRARSQGYLETRSDERQRLVCEILRHVVYETLRLYQF